MLTSPAKKCFDELSNNKNYEIIKCIEELTHDGHDNYGPKSDIWNLYILYKHIDTNEYFVNLYHWEDWFQQNITSNYDLWTTYNNTSGRLPKTVAKLFDQFGLLNI